jgi:hypothetical protein
LCLIRTNDAGLRHLVTVLLNTVEGARPSRADLLAQCLYMIEHFGYDQGQTALQFGLPLDSIRTERRRNVTRQRLARTGVKPEAFSMRTLDGLHTLSNDVAFRSAATALAAAKVTDADARRFIGEMREQRTEATAEATAQQFLDRDEVKLLRAGLTKRRPSGPPAMRAKLMTHLNSALGILRKEKTRAGLGLTSDDDMAKALEVGYSVLQGLEDVRNATA